MTLLLDDLCSGLRYLFRGMGIVLRNRRLALLGMVPPLLVSAVMVTGIGLLGFFGLAPLTGFATGWVPDPLRLWVRIFLGAVIMVLAIVVAVVLFVSITLAVGSPIYEKVSIAVEREVREVTPAPAEPVLAGVIRSGRQSVVIVLLSALTALVLFLLGLIPVVGALLSLVLGAVVGGYFLVLEMISGPFDRWGLRTLGDKIAAVNANRVRAGGFGIPVFLLFSIPIISVLLFPAATAGATLLAHDLDPAKGLNQHRR